jgi:two-component system sensor histidine kinase UhpB
MNDLCDSTHQPECPGALIVSLRFRLNLLITALFVSILALGTALVIYNARRAVVEESQSAANLALRLLEVAYVSADQSTQEELRARLRREMQSFESARHLQVALIEGERELALAESVADAEPAAPDWYVRLVAPAPTELRRAVVSAAGGHAEIVVRADPVDEVDESWEDARTLLGLLLAFSLIANGLVFFTIGHWLKPVERIVGALDGIEQGDYRTRLPAFGLPELAAVADKVNHMAEVLEQSREQNRALTQQSLAIQESERRALARELHDELGQSISAIKAVAVSIEQGGERGSKTAAAASTIAEISSQMYAVVRGMMRRLRPVVLDEFGLVRALEELVDGWNERHADAFCKLKTTGALSNLPDTLAIHVYRIVQEALTNVSKHSGGAEVEVQLERLQSLGEDALHLAIRDDGAGFDPASQHEGLGLRGMRERVDALHGSFELVTSGGVAIAVTIPLQTRPA